MSNVLKDLKASFPARSSQLDQLYEIFATEKDEPLVDNIYIYGGSSTGKSAIISSLFNKLAIPHATINLIECYTSKILFESILSQFANDSSVSSYRCDNMMDFLQSVKQLHAEINLHGYALVLDKAEQLRRMDFNLLPVFMRLRELTAVNISVVFLSEIVFEKYYSRGNVIEPIKIFFPQYNKDQLLTILELDYAHCKSSTANKFKQASVEFDQEFFRNYLNLFLSVFYRACRDLSELRHMARMNFFKYYEPIANGDCKLTDQMALWRHVAPILKSSLEVLYLRVSDSSMNEGKEAKLSSLELPYYAKYLLIAAYLASYNSVKEDKRLFMKHHGKQRKTNKDVKKSTKLAEQLNTQLGPKMFSFDRLLAIFYAILDDKVGFNNNLLAQVSSLVELQLLSTNGDNMSLDGQKYKCNVGLDFIQKVAKMVGFNIRKYLSDFAH